MSLYRKRNQRRATLVGAGIGAIIIFTFVISLIEPNLGSRQNSIDTLPTTTPFGTPAPSLTPTRVIFPTPEANPQLEGELPYIHSSGYFQTFRPAGTDWFITDNPLDEQGTRLNVVLQSGPRLVVIHNFLQPGVEFDTLDTLGANFLTAEYYANEWSRYDGWQETGREVTDSAAIVSFDLTADGNAYRGRDISWLEGGWLYVTRLVVPANNPSLLDLLQKLVIPVFSGYHDLQKLPQLWPVYADQQLGFALKYPPGWQRVAGDNGRPVTFSAPTGQPKTTIRAWVEPAQTVETEDQASAWVAQTEITAAILNVAPVEHELGAGFQVSYSYTDEEGDPHSGLMVLLHGEAKTLYIANLHLDTPDINLLEVENLSVADNDTRQIVADGFILLPPGAYRPSPASVEPQATEGATEIATEAATEAPAAQATEASTEAATETAATEAP
jgi:hypothetical protein